LLIRAGQIRARVIFITRHGWDLVYKRSMRFGKFISSALLFTVLMAPVLGLAMCVSTDAPAPSGCAHCAKMSHAQSAPQHSPAPSKAPCCERKAPTTAVTETAAQIVAPVQIALAPADTTVVLLPTTLTAHVELVATPPPLSSPLSLLCTLLI